MKSNMFELMRIFVSIVEQGSFTKAAAALQLHRPAVSKAIQELENNLGVKLLHRTTRSLSVTDEGEEVYHRSLLLLDDLNAMMESFSQTVSVRGRLHIDAALALTHVLLIPHLDDFQALYPEIEIVVTASDSKKNLISEGIDCVIRLGELDDSNLIARHIGNIRMVTCATPEYLEQHGQPLTPADLQHHKVINFFSEHSREVMEWRFVVDGKITSQRLKSSMLVNNSDVLLSCGLAGLGIIHALSTTLDSYIKSGVLREVLQSYAIVEMPVSILYSDRRHLPPRVRVFIDWFVEVFEKKYSLNNPTSNKKI